MKAAPICNGCLRRRTKPVECTNPSCPHHATCAFCGARTDGRFLGVASPKPRAHPQQRRS